MAETTIHHPDVTTTARATTDNHNVTTIHKAAQLSQAEVMLRSILAFVGYGKIGTMADSTEFLWLEQNINIVALQVELLKFFVETHIWVHKFWNSD